MKRSRRGIAVGVAGLVACLAIVVFEVVWSIGQFTAARHLDTYGIAADATVASVKDQFTFGEYVLPWSKVTVVFVDTRGQRVRAHYVASEGGGGAVPHTRIQIRYDPQHPTVVKPVGLHFTSRTEDGIWFLLSVGLPAAYGAGFFVVRIRRQLHPVAASARVPRRCLLELRSPGVGSVAVFSPDGTRLATASTGPIGKRDREAGARNVGVWDATTGAHLFDVDHPQVRTLTFSPDSRCLITDSPNQARVFDSAGTLLFEIGSGTTKVVTSGLLFRPRLQRWIAAGRSVQVSDTLGGIVLAIRYRRLASSSSTVVVFSPDGARLVTAGSGRKAMIWDATTGKHLLNLKARVGVRLTRVMFSPDGAYLAGTCSDKSARVYNTFTGEQLLKLWHTRSLDVTDIAFSPDSARLATTGTDHVTRIWALREHRPVAGAGAP